MIKSDLFILPFHSGLGKICHKVIMEIKVYPCLAPRMLSTHSPTRHKKAQNVKRSSYGRKGIKYNKIIRSETGKRAEIEKMKEEKEV